MSRTLGIDISRYQHGFDWSAVAADGVRFAMGKATEGLTHVDARFEQHHADAERAGLLTGSYHTFLPHKDPDLQARHYYKTVAERTHLPPAIHFETLGGMSGEDALFRARRFIEITEVLWDRPCIVSTYSAFWVLLGDPGAPELGARTLWIADHRKKGPEVPRPWVEAGWTFWKLDGDGANHLPGGVDADFHWYNGSEDELHEFCRRNAPTVDSQS